MSGHGPRLSTRTLLRVAGVLVWAFAGIPAGISIAHQPRTSALGLAIWIGAFVVFGAAFLRASRADAPESRAAARLLAIETLAALTMNIVLCTGFEVALVIIVAVQLGVAGFPLLAAAAWLAVQTALVSALAIVHMGSRAGSYWSVAVVGMEAFAFTIAAIAGREAAARRALERANAELEATRDSLARASRDAERLRIARDLHDVLGHHLIALHLELETARHVADARTGGHVERAHTIARGLLADVRKAVTSLRTDEGPVDVARDVRAIVEKIHAPRVHLDAPATLGIDDVERATAVVRCVQEIVTNTIKHAAAANLWIAIVPGKGSVELTARDDGRGSAAAEGGHGLVGMRERVERLGGELVLETNPGDGFRVRATVPLLAAAPLPEGRA